MNWRKFHPLLLLILASPGHSEEVRFNRDIQPILARNCFACHGPDEHERKAKLRLDTEEGFRKGGKSGNPITVASKAEESLLWELISSTDPDEIMPPPEAHKELKNEEKELIRQWIQQGARYEGHWAFITPRLPPIPPIEEKNPIDRFVGARLAAEGLTFGPEASPRVLARRLHLDLTGLPPTPRELQDFLSDDHPDAYAMLVKRLLDSPHFGEQMALPWLDAARYASR